MNNFAKIDWKTFNKPPFYQQWLCKEDTLKLTTFGDEGLSELDDKIISLKDQWDLDNATGDFLDRIGKLLDEARNGNSDEVYRIILNLRKLLNTNEASIPDIIKAIKYLYSSEVVHIVPDYPAGLIIEHDGEGTPGLNFNKLLSEVVAAGVSFSTKELFNFTDEFEITDILKIIVQRRASDSFQNGLKYDGRGKYDGHTLNGTQTVLLNYNGQHKYNGVIKYSRTRNIEFDTFVIIPFKYNNGIKDVLVSNISKHFIDEAKGQLKHNRSIKHNGKEKYSGFGNDSSYETLKNKINDVLYDLLTTAENLSVKTIKPLDSHFTTRNKYDGYFNHSGEMKHNAANEAISMTGDTASITDNVETADNLFIGKRFLRKFNGAYHYDGAILYNGNVLIPVEEE